MGIYTEIPYEEIFEKKLFLPMGHLILRFTTPNIKWKNEVLKSSLFKVSSCGPHNSKVYSENGRSVALPVLELWHFLYPKTAFYSKKPFLDVKSAITQERVEQ